MINIISTSSYKANKFKSDISKFVKSVINLIRKGYNLTTIAHSLRQDYFSKNIDTVPHLYIDLAD